MARFAAALAFFHPEIEALTFPAWDCLPYDRVSPNGEIVSRRIDTLTRLAAGPHAYPPPPAGEGRDGALVVLTTVNALVQRVPPRRLFDGRVLTLRPGGRIGGDRLQSFFRNNGYVRTDTVREPGEFAVRGGIVDLYPAGAAQPLRLDFFGDTIESIRSFDPLTQRSTGTEAEAVLRPVSEVLLDDDAIRRFRQRYREEFGATGTDDPLYEIGQRRTPLCRHGALAAALLRAARDPVRLSSRRRAVVRPSGRGSPRPPARSDRRVLRRAAQRDRGRARQRPGVPRVAPRPALSRRARMAGRARRPAGRANIAVCDARRRWPTGSMPARGRCATSPPSGPIPRSCCSRRSATISKPSAEPAAKPRSPRSAKARPTGSRPCCASAASPICAGSPTATR